MDDEDSISGLEALNRDLRALIELKLPVLDRLLGNLEGHLDGLKALLDKKPKNDESRKALGTGKITIGGNEYEINSEFAQETIQLADGLDLDELQAAALFLGAEQHAKELDRPRTQTAVIRFHRRRELVLLCLRQLAKAALDSADDDIEGQELLLRAVQMIVGVESGGAFENAYKFWARCLASMEQIEVWLNSIGERVQSAQVVGQAADAAFEETMKIQRESLTRQHENLAAICTHMAKAGFTNKDNFDKLLARVKKLDRHDLITIHYVPMVMRVTTAVAESTSDTKEIRAIHDRLMASRETESWPLRNFQAASLAWWLAEYSSRYTDPNPHDPDLRNVNFDEEANGRSDAFLKALNDGAFHFILSVSQDVRPTKWYDPAKTSMISKLLHDTAILPPDSMPFGDFFKDLVMHQLQTFVDSFITNMPDTLRRLKAEEDDQRRRFQMSFQPSAAEQPFHLERFLLIVSYAYDGYTDAAEEFWTDRESNLYGFLQWAAKRQPTPRIAMFCEMIRAISTGEANAESAHAFLLDDGGSTSGRMRRTSSLGYTHIFNELLEFQRNIHEPKKHIQGGLYQPAPTPLDHIIEPESATMLESYLRLLAHLCRQSPAAREWLLNHTEYNVMGIYFSLCVDTVDTTLRASAFDAISALLMEKTVPQAASVWHSLEDWTISGFYASSKSSNTMSPMPREEFWSTLANGYDESLAFVRLLLSLVEPYTNSLSLNDTLPFPEGLGSARRMPGVQVFIDFVLDKVFAQRSPDVQDLLKQNVMRETCLRFIAVCLDTFNEDLVVFANKSNIDVDAVIDASSLAAYVTLHPFTRVMEWLFNDKVLRALFACSHYDVSEVDAAPMDSPLVQSLMTSIKVMGLIMKLQSTYLDIVRPLIKQQPSFQHSQVSNISLASFEDAILNNLQLIVDLGLYCGTGHEELTLASLDLLEKLASSRKLAVSPAGFGQRSGRSKIVGILERDNEGERIGRCLAGLMRFDEEELSVGPEVAGYILKLRVLDFLISCLGTVSTRPTIAHILLGFSCGATSVQIADNSLWANGQSLFHAILLLAVTYPDNDGETFVSWRSEIKTRCWDVLQRLWRSPLTSAVVMDELNLNQLLFVQAPQLNVVDMNTSWDGLSLAQGIEAQADGALSPFFSDSPSLALQNFLQLRAAFLDYESRELRLTIKEGLATKKARVQSVLLGVTITPGSESTRNPSIFDLFDFIEFDIPERPLPVQHELLAGVDLAMFQEEKDGYVLYSIPLLEQLFLLEMKQWRKIGRFARVEEELSMSEAAAQIIFIFQDYNRRAQVVHYHREILRSWVQVMRVTLQGCDFEPTARTSFILQTFQVILPKLEVSYNGDIFTALQLASLAEALIQKMEFESTALEKTRTGDFANDRLSRLFRAALLGVSCPVTTTELREYCYQIAFRYIHGTFAKSTKGSALGKNTLNTVKQCGNHLLEVVCDDAYSGQGTCKLSALLLLTALVSVATRQESKYILESFVALNFIGVLVDNIKHINHELGSAAAPQIPILLQYYDASLALLLRICQTRLGAAYVLNAGLFPAIRESGIFEVDADIGLGFDDPNALKKYYDLILAVLRVINAAVISRGRQNEQTIFQAREFLKQNRKTMVTIFKRSVNVGVGKDKDEDLSDLVDCFTVLVDFTGFLQYEESTSLKTKDDKTDFFS